jgi:neutral ceramidase
VSWFAVHNTSMSNRNRLISGDNKGYAGVLFEREQGADYSERSFVAAFAQSNEGDVTPNVTPPDGRGGDEVAATERSGRAQYEAARRLFAAASDAVGAPVDFRHTFVAFDRLATAQGRTCPSAVGVSMLAGAEDGPGVGEEGVSCAVLERTHPLLALATGCFGGSSGCQAEKPPAVRMGLMRPPWSPEVLPLQVLRVGSLAIVGVPFEMTTMAGRRLRETVAARLGPAGVKTVVVAGLANAYAGYVATREEYAAQHYEGASTHFGPWTLAALLQQLDGLAAAMAAHAPVPAGPSPRDLGRQQVELVTGARVDALPDGARFGDVVTDARAAYAPGEVVSVRFQAADPGRDLRLQGSYLAVERRRGADWAVVARDRDWETTVRWEPMGPARDGGRAFRATVEWHVPPGTSGTYRIRFEGTALPRGGRPAAFTGTSREFDVR